LEDDALFTDKGAKEFWRLLAEVDRLPKEIPAYVLASEGLSLEAFGLKAQDFTIVSSCLRTPPFPLTNTSAAYLLNKSLARHFVSSLENHPSLASNTIDFLINNLMLRLFLDKQDLGIACYHAMNPSFQNASIGGRYSSLISD
jgi:hypothetical protein